MGRDTNWVAVANVAYLLARKAAPLLAAAAGVFIVQWAVRWYRVRTMIRRLRGSGIVCP